MALSVIHITDPHLLAEPGARLHGWDVAHAFDRVLAAAVAAQPDFDALVLGGDLVDDESTAGYRWLNARLAALRRPVLAIAGNHDQPARMARELSAARVHAAVGLENWQLIGLNSHRRDSAAGRLGRAQLAALDPELARGEAPVALFVHHPPWSVGSAWIDAIGLADGPELIDLIASRPRVRAVVCGHAHQAHRADLGGATGLVTPSTMRQFLPAAEAFAEDPHHAPGYRWLRLEAARMTAGVVRVALG